ncbi:MAG: hypothetical protein ACXWRU_12520 [Pseudobdellovibrionaceae bacterium]
MISKWTLILRAFCFTQQVLAFTENQSGFEETEAAAGCIDCSNSDAKTAMGALSEFAKNMKSTLQVASTVDGMVSDRHKYAPSCDKFVDDGEYQRLGKVVIKEVNRPENKALYDGTKDLIKICPKYNNGMSKEEKDGLWVLFSAGWAQKESSCAAPRVKDGKGPNGTLSGILRMHKGHEQDYKYGVFCKRGDAKTEESSFHCSISMLTGWIEMGHRLFDPGSHWEVLRPYSKAAQAIMNSIRRYPPCGSPPPMLAQRSQKKRHVADAKHGSKSRVALSQQE